MPDLADQIKAYYDATTTRVDIDRIVAGGELRASVPDGLPTDDRPFHTTNTRRHTMSVELETRPDQSTATRGHRRMAMIIGLAAAAVVTLIAALVVVAATRDEEPLQPATPPEAPAPPTDDDAEQPDITAEDDAEDPATPTDDDAEQPATRTAAGTTEVMRAFEAAVNARDIDGIMALYADDAVLLDHPEGAAVVRGHEDIRTVERVNLLGLASRTGQVFWITGLEVEGTKAWFGQLYHSPTGCYSGTGANATVEGGLITEYEWGSYGLPCVRDLLRDFEERASGTTEPTPVVGCLIAETCAVAPLFSSDATLTGHPDAAGAPAVGGASIETALRTGLSTLPAGTTVELDGTEVVGPVATFDLVYRTTDGCTRSTGHRVTAEGDRIVSWEWGGEPAPCD